MFFNDEKEEALTKILLTDIKIEDLTKEKNLILRELDDINEKLQKDKSIISELESEIEELKKKDSLLPNEKNHIQSSITKIFDIEDDISSLEKEKIKRKIKETELEQLLEIEREIKEEFKNILN